MPGITIWTPDYSLAVYLPFGPNGPKVAGGGMKLDRPARPKRKELTEPNGRAALQVTTDFFLDGFATGEGLDIERAIRTLEKMWGQDAGDPDPPELLIMGDPPGCVPNDQHDAKHLTWWLETIQEDDGTLRNSSGNRIRVAGSIVLTEVVQDELLGKLPAAKRHTKPKTARGKSGPRRRTHRVASGETLSKIAAHYKLDWHDLAKLNGIRDPKTIKVGQVLRLS
jgi:hypothetical protein